MCFAWMCLLWLGFGKVGCWILWWCLSSRLLLLLSKMLLICVAFDEGELRSLYPFVQDTDTAITEHLMLGGLVRSSEVLVILKWKGG